LAGGICKLIDNLSSIDCICHTNSAKERKVQTPVNWHGLKAERESTLFKAAANFTDRLRDQWNQKSDLRGAVALRHLQ